MNNIVVPRFKYFNPLIFYLEAKFPVLSDVVVAGQVVLAVSCFFLEVL